MKRLYHTVITAILISVLAPTASGQENALQDQNFIIRTNPWITSSNAAGLCTLPVTRTSYTEVFYGKQNGGLCDLTESTNSFDAGVQTESYIKVSDRIHFYGNLSYRFFNGEEMGGPILMDPSYNPINFYEEDTTNLGTKSRESYHLTGGMSYSVNDKWSLGCMIDYESADQTKIKDPRFLNVWMDLALTAGARFAPTEYFSAGANLEYRRTLEQIDGDIIGVTGEKYFTFIDLGGFYGSRELFDGDYGFVPVSSVRPMFNSIYGGSLQIEVGKDTKVFNELSYRKREGYYGKQSSTTIVYTEHSGNEFSYKGVLVTGKGDNRHRIGLDFSYTLLNNAENIYRMNTEVGQYTVVEYFGQNDVLKRTDIGAALSYTGYLGISDNLPNWEFGATGGLDMRNTMTTIYPYYRSCSVSNLHIDAYGLRNMTFHGKNVITVGLQGRFGMGFGTPRLDGTLAGSTSNAPKSADVYLDRDFEYKTGMHAGCGLRVRYTRLLNTRFAAYIEAIELYTQLLKKPEYLLGNNRNIFEIKIGCEF